MSAKGKMIELNRGVSDINMKRAYLSSIMLSVAIPVTVIAAYIGKWSAVSVRNIYCCGCSDGNFSACIYVCFKEAVRS